MEFLKLFARISNPKKFFKFTNVLDRECPDLEDVFWEGRAKGLLICFYICVFALAITGILEIAF